MSEKFVWTKANTSLLISVWSDKSVQKNLQDTPRNVAIWNGIARYLKKRGIDVNWLKCRERMKRLVVRYRMIKRGAKLKPKNMVDSFFKELDLVMSPQNNLTADSSLCSSSLDISTEAATSVEYLPQEPELRQYTRARPRLRPMHNETLEFKESEAMEYIQSQSPKIEPDEYVTDNDPCASPNNVDSAEVVVNAQCVPVLGDQDTTYLDSAVHLAYAKPTNSGNPSRPRSENEEKDPNCLVKEAIANESGTITRVLLAQAEATRRLLEANRMRQERLESRMDKIVGQLEQMTPATNQGIATKLEAKLDSILNKLHHIIPHSKARTSENTLDKKMDVVLERLEHIIPCLEQYNSSAPNLVDKMDSMLLGLDKIAPNAYDLIEVNTDE